MNIVNRMAKQVKKGTGNALELVVGIRVQHTVSGMIGEIFETASVGSLNTISIRTSTGRELRNLNRQEFVLYSPAAGGVSVVASEPKSTKIEVLEGIAGTGYSDVTVELPASAVSVETVAATTTHGGYGSTLGMEIE